MCSLNEDWEDQMCLAWNFVGRGWLHCLVVQALLINSLEIFAVREVYLNHSRPLHHHDIVFKVFLEKEFARFAILRQKKVCHFRLVELDHLERNLVSVISFLLQGCFKVLECLLDKLPGGVGFACPGLSISNDAHLLAIDGVIDQLKVGLKNFLLRCLLRKDFIEPYDLGFMNLACHADCFAGCKVARFFSFPVLLLSRGKWTYTQLDYNLH